MGLLTCNDIYQTLKAAIFTLTARNKMALTFFEIKGEDRAARAGDVGSPARQEAVVSFYDKVLKSPCVEWGDGAIFNNPFYQATEESWNWQEYKNALTYTAQRWNGIETFSLHCVDGWNSPSIGKLGACSHHGGVTSGFNQFSKWDLTNHITLGQAIFPPLAQLQNAVNS